MDTLVQSSDRALYDADEHAWIARQIDALRSGRLHLLDRDTLVEYLTEMTIRDRRELESRFAVLLQHMLKLMVQPGRHTRSWDLTVTTQQQEIRRLLKALPSLAAQRQAVIPDAYRDAVLRAVKETGESISVFPRESPWTADAALAFEPPKPPTRATWRPARRT